MVDLTVSCIFGGVPINRQIKRLVHGNDVIVATPGRLIDLLERKAIRLNEIEILILDEADQMMDMGFIHALKKIIPALPKKRQTLSVSAISK
jgi:ATP-dependent RNA helicase RhlE